ncbi:unnamed protein product [Spirodela intermedia]|uniref:XS domain-containing protein n=1 Tax=Spirodela intermedia TaxID=51605 RepID=A0A7I8IUA3_SPIIN|nr:unnamed protein product [Spirodela intermedia]CAA6660718.1 unnamed protein product [Spirodela intermedia]
MRASRKGGGGASSGRDFSPPPHVSSSRSRDLTRRSEWGNYTICSRYSPTPGTVAMGHDGRRNPRRSSSVGRGRRSASIERGGYDAFDVAAAAAAAASRRHQQRQDRSPPPLPLQPWGGRGALVLDGDDGFYREYPGPESPSDLHLAANSKLGRVVKVREFRQHPHSGNGGPRTKLSCSSGTAIEDHGVMVQKSVYLEDDGSVRELFPLPPEQAVYQKEASALDSGSLGRTSGGSALRIGMRGAEEERAYEEEHGLRIYSGRDYSPYRAPFPSQRRPPAAASSSGAPRDEFLVSYRDELRRPSDDGLGRGGGFGSFRDEILGHDGYSRTHPLDTKTRRISPPPIRDEPRGRSFSEYERRGRDDDDDGEWYSGSGRSCKKVRWGSRGNSRRVDDIEVSPKMVRDSRIWDQRRYLEEGTISDYQEMEGVRGEYLGGSGSVSFAYKTKASHGGEVLQLGSRTSRYGRDDRVSYREPARSPPPSLSERYTGGALRRTLSPPREGMDMEELDNGEAPLERVLPGRDYMTEEEINILRETRNARAIELNEEEERWADEERMETPSPRRPHFDRSRLRTLPRRVSDSGDWLPSDGSFVQSGGGGQGSDLKRRLRPGFHSSFSSDRRRDFDRSQRSRKKGLEDQRTLSDFDGNALENERHRAKNDPPEDTEEFRQQLHKAFLRFSKLLNEDPIQQEKYRDGGKARGLLCCVCGSQSKEFVDTHSLVTHAFHSLKVGLRTEHLGLHKALCVLMCWNWLVSPDNSRAYQMRPGPEHEALKEDLIIWPPVVIVRNFSVINTATTTTTTTTTTRGTNCREGGPGEDTERFMKIEVGKVKVCGGKPSDQRTLLVKFMATFSGLQEADRLHRLFTERKHGRKELDDAASMQSSGDGAEPQVEGGSDLDRLDPETKRRCILKSRREIEDIADAPVKVE